MKYFYIISFVCLLQDGFSQLVSFTQLPDTLSKKDTSLIYFHFEGCPPCKKMNRELFEKFDINEISNYRMALYSVADFDPKEVRIREKYNNKCNPEFIILEGDSVLHRFSGYHTKEDFIDQLNIARSTHSYSSLKYKIESQEFTKHELELFIENSRKINQLDSSLIAFYLNKSKQYKIEHDEYVYKIAKYGYLNAEKLLPSNSPHFDYLLNSYENDQLSIDKELIRVRLLLSYYMDYHSCDEEDKAYLLSEIKKLENGNHNILRALDLSSDMAYLPFLYPSNYLELEALDNDTISYKKWIKKLLTDYVESPNELYLIAEEIHLKADTKVSCTGLLITEKLVSLAPKNYDYIELHALFLKKCGKDKDAHRFANIAVELAQNNDQEPPKNIREIANSKPH